MKEPLRRILLIVCVLVFVVCAGLIIRTLVEYAQADKIYEKSREELFAVVEADVESAAFPVEVDFDSLLAINPDIVGWIWLPDTTISYPLLLSKDNQDYLRHTYEGTANRAGSIFIDYRNQGDLSDRNTVIYGHNMKNDAMFSSLSNFLEADFFAANPYFYILTPQAVYQYQILSAYQSDTNATAYTWQFADDAAFATFVEEILTASAVQPPLAAAEIGSDAKIVTLSTCTNTGYTKRYLVHGLLVEQK